MLEMEIFGVTQASKNQFPLVLLKHENRVLPILVGLPEASAIQIGLLKEKMARPMTHDLIGNIFAGLRATLKSVTIYRLQNDTFFAHLNVEQKNAEGHVEQVLRIDTRPSDGIAIAVRIGCPVYVAEEVLDAAGQDASVLSDNEEGGEEDIENEEDFGIE